MTTDPERGGAEDEPHEHARDDGASRIAEAPPSSERRVSRTPDRVPDRLPREQPFEPPDPPHHVPTQRPVYRRRKRQLPETVAQRNTQTRSDGRRGTEKPSTQSPPVSSPPPRAHHDNADHSVAEEAWTDFADAFEETIAKPGRQALHTFFYPSRSASNARSNSGTNHGDRHTRISTQCRTVETAPSRLASSREGSALARIQTERQQQKTLHKQQQQQQECNRRHERSDRIAARENSSQPITQSQAESPPQSSSSPPHPHNDRSVPVGNDTVDDEQTAEQPSPVSLYRRSHSTPLPNSMETPVNQRNGHRPLSTLSRQRKRKPRSKRQKRPTQRSVPRDEQDRILLEQQRQDREYVEKFWTAYDEFLILSLFTQVGILCRLAAAYWFRFFDSVFRVDSALFVNLPLNCLSCFVLGMLGSGENLMEIISTRFTPPRLQQELHNEAQASIEQQEAMMEELDYWDALIETSTNTGASSDDHHSHTTSQPGSLQDGLFTSGLRRRRNVRSNMRQSGPSTPRWQPRQTQQDLQTELREVQLLALERRIRMSPCLLLFPVKKEDVDVVESYFNEGYQSNRSQSIASSPTSVSHGRQCLDVEEPAGDSLQDHRCDELRQGQSFDSGHEELFLDENDFDDLILEEEGPSITEAPKVPTKALSPAEAAVASIAARDAIRKSRIADKTSDDRSLTTPDMPHSDHPTEAPAQPKRSGQSPQSLPDGRFEGYTSPIRPATPQPQEQPPTEPLQSHTEARPLPMPPLTPSEPHPIRHLQSSTTTAESVTPQGREHAHEVPHSRHLAYARAPGGNVVDYGQNAHTDIDILITNVATGVSQKLSRMSRVSLANGWDVGTSPEEKSEDLMLGLRVGLCGALSSFSSWLSSMVLLLKSGELGQAFVGLVLGIQLPIVSYRFGQHVAVYTFIWRCRRETRRDERRGYGIRLSMDDESDDGDSYVDSLGDSNHLGRARRSRTKGRRTVHEEESGDETPSVRAIITALFILAFVAQLTALNFFHSTETRLLALSLFFSPLGVITRWRLSKLNSWRPNFPIGTFTCNLMACALSGSLGSILAGNLGPRGRIILLSIIDGFGGTLSSVARFIVEILEGTDPVLFRLDGIYYAFSSIFWGCIVSFVFSASFDWVESVGQPAAVEEAAEEAAALSSSDGGI